MTHRIKIAAAGFSIVAIGLLIFASSQKHSALPASEQAAPGNNPHRQDTHRRILNLGSIEVALEKQIREGYQHDGIEGWDKERLVTELGRLTEQARSTGRLFEWQIALDQIIQLNPSLFMEALPDLRARMDISFEGILAADVWQDRDELLDWVNDSSYLRALMVRGDSRNLESVADLADLVSISKRGEPLPTFREDAFHAMSRLLEKEDTGLAKMRIYDEAFHDPRIRDNSEMAGILREATLRAVPLEFIQQHQDQLDQLTGTPEIAHSATAVGEGMVKEDPEEGLKQISQLKNAAFQEQAIQQLFGAWLRADSYAAGKAALNMEEPHLRELAYDQIIEYLRSKGSNTEADAWEAAKTSKKE